jgi:predicted lactoylglutathione lyase
MRMIFVNLPVKKIEATKAFFAALGFSFNPDFSDDKTACMIIEENIFAMLLEEDRFREFINNDISDATKAQEVLVALSTGSRAEVDDILAKALAAGAKPWKPIMDLGFMYGCSFQDIDGHVWEVVHMDQPAQ